MPSGALQFKQLHWRTRRWWVLANYACNSDSFILNTQWHNITSYWRLIELCYSRSRLVCKASFMFTCRCEWFIRYDSDRIRLAHKVRSITNTPDIRSTPVHRTRFSSTPPSPAPWVRPKRCRRTSAIKLATVVVTDCKQVSSCCSVNMWVYGHWLTVGVICTRLFAAPSSADFAFPSQTKVFIRSCLFIVNPFNKWGSWCNQARQQQPSFLTVSHSSHYCVLKTSQIHLPMCSFHGSDRVTVRCEAGKQAARWQQPRDERSHRRLYQGEASPSENIKPDRLCESEAFCQNNSFLMTAQTFITVSFLLL